jgi:hypothetical protein
MTARRLALAALSALAVTPGAAGAASPTLDLRHAATTEIVGARAGDHAGGTVAPAGDVNGDGLADVLVAAPGASGPGRRDAAGAVYVVFGRRRRHLQTRVVVSRTARQQAAQGFRILGPETADQLRAVAAAGDVNGDGLGDVVVSFVDALRSRGETYVVFGQRGGTTIDLAHLGTRGIDITSSVPSDVWLGHSVAGGRDVDGDGRPDVVVTTAPGASGKGNAYVILGGTPAGRLSVPDGLGIHGYAIADAGGGVTLAKDMNGDGRAEIVLGHGGSAPNALATVLFGRVAGSAPTDLMALGAADGFQIATPPGVPASGSGGSVTGGDDVDGDGRGDVVVGATLSLTKDAHGVKPRPNVASVVFGAPSGATVTLGTPSPRLLSLAFPEKKDPYFRFDNGVQNGFSEIGTRAGLVGDVDGDGRADIALNGADDVRGRAEAGSVWVVRGRGAGTVPMAAAGGNALRIDGAYAHDGLQSIASAGGDFDGDGRPDLIIGGADATRASRKAAGLAWIVSGAKP